MANWSKYIEDTIQLPVYKRAKHGVHFQRSDGQIQAEFSGKPCHYLDGGLWKPIDTKLLLGGDGYYGCPHSKVRISKDGYVKVEGTDYVQRVELPTAQVGLIDGDVMVRKFAFGEQRLWVTENGFRSEIILNRIPTLSEARKLVPTEAGILPKDYIKSLTTATDANDDVHTFTTLSAFRTWLSTAKFPVTIDPDISALSPYGDNFLVSFAPNHNRGALASAMLNDGTLILRYDLSSIPASAICNSATHKFTKLNAPQSSYATSLLIYEIASANSDWVEGTKTFAVEGGSSCWNYKKYDTDAWAGSAGCATAGTDYINTNLTTTSINRADEKYTEYNINFNASGISAVEGWFGVTNPGFIMKLGVSVEIGLSENTTESYRPVLSVTYTAGGNPHYAYAQQ